MLTEDGKTNLKFKIAFGNLKEDFKNNFPDLFKDFQKAIGKFEEFFNR